MVASSAMNVSWARQYHLVVRVYMIMRVPTYNTTRFMKNDRHASLNSTKLFFRLAYVQLVDVDRMT